MAQKHRYYIDNNKNTVKDSSISAGNNVHIGDIHNHSSPPQKPKQNTSKNIIIVLALLVVIFGGVNLYNHRKEPASPTLATDTLSTSPQPGKANQTHINHSKLASPTPKKNNQALEVILASGLLTDGDTNNPIEGAIVSVIGVAGEFTTTDKTGTFSLTSKTITQDKEYRLRFERSGYEPEVFTYHKTNKIVEVKLFRSKKR